MTSCTGSTRAEDLGILKKLVELSSASEEDGWLLLARWGLGWVPHDMEAERDEKARIERMCISLLMSKKPLNSKVIKSFVPELRSRKCFSCFEFPMFYVYMLRTLWTFCVLVWICPFHVFVSWVWSNKRHFLLSTYFFVNPFELPYWSYDIRLELVDKPSIISNFPSTFCPTLGHPHVRMYYKREVTFVYTLLLCKKSVCTVVLCSVYFSKLVL